MICESEPGWKRAFESIMKRRECFCNVIVLTSCWFISDVSPRGNGVSSKSTTQLAAMVMRIKYSKGIQRVKV